MSGAQYRQGGLLLVAVSRVPAGSVVLPRAAAELLVAEVEEDGNLPARAHWNAVDRHVIDEPGAELVEHPDGGQWLLRVTGEGVRLVHRPPPKRAAHQSIAVPPGLYRVIRQRGYDPGAPPRHRQPRIRPDRRRREDDVLDECVAGMLCTAEADRPVAEEAITRLYELQGLPPPVFLWVASPLAGALVQHVLTRDGKPLPWQHPASGYWWTLIDAGVAESVRAAITTGAADRRFARALPPADWSADDATDALLHRLHSVPVREPFSSLPARIEASWFGPPTPVDVGVLCRKRVPRAVRRAFRWRLQDPQRLVATIESADGAWAMERVTMQKVLRMNGQFAARYWLLDAYRRLEHTRYPKPARTMLDLLLDTSRSCATWWPAGGLCIVVDHPARIEVEWADGNASLHSASGGPAVAWRDGSERYAWRGTVVDKRIIAGKAKIRDWRRGSLAVNEAFAQRMGCRWLLRETRSVADSTGSLAEKVADDEHGTLWHIGSGFGNLPSIVVLECAHPGSFSSRRTVVRVPPDMTRPRDALAWTFGLRPDAYHPTIAT